jgi:hypothetical protein
MALWIGDEGQSKKDSSAKAAESGGGPRFADSVRNDTFFIAN